MKKWWSIILVSMFLMSLVACSEDDATNEEDKTELQEETEENEEEPNEDEVEDNIDSIIKDESEITEDAKITALVNKKYGLSKDYIPEDLVTVDVPTVLENSEVKQLREEAAKALKEMFTEAEKSDLYLHARSGYRSYDTQVELFNNYAAEHGKEEANRYSAKPGHSEHQTGLVMDVTSESVNLELEEAFGETEEGIWLKEHAHEFGFIIRYPQGKEEITGYIYEPWHIRYLGVEVATAVYDSGLTYEEYLYEEGLIHEVNSEQE